MSQVLSRVCRKFCREQRISKEVECLETIGAAADKIRKQVEVIDDEVRKGRANLARVVEDAKKTLLALKVELHDDEAERASPIELGAPANDDGAAALATPAE